MKICSGARREVALDAHKLGPVEIGGTRSS
jgi:hypothetical protein